MTLTTDVGSLYAAQMKAALLEFVAPGEIIDIAHDLPRHGIREAAFVLRQVATQFPPGSVHVAVIDPGVGGRRAPVAVACSDGSLLVGPDNGVLWPLAESLGKPRAYRLDPVRVALPGRRVSATFEGRDLFAPAAGRLARGRAVRELGAPTHLKRLDLPAPVSTRSGATGEVVHVDRFGNLISNLPTEWLPPIGLRARVRLGTSAWRTVPSVRTYEEIAALGRVALLGSSFGTVEVSVREGSAAETLRAGVGSRVELGRLRRKDRK